MKGRQRVLMIVHSWYPYDTRVRREAEALVEANLETDVICLRGKGEPKEDVCCGVRVYRMPLNRHRGRGLTGYLLETVMFLALASIKAGLLCWRKRYQIVQVHNMPDFLVLASLFPRILGAKVILDMHDLCPEVLQAKSGDSRIACMLLRLVEKGSAVLSHHIITVGTPFKEILVRRGIPAEKITILTNSADPKFFRQQNHPPSVDEALALIYHGSLLKRCGVDIAIEALDLARREMPVLRLEIYGEGEEEAALRRMVIERGLEGHVYFGGQRASQDMPSLIASCDAGIALYRANKYSDLLLPTKVFECVAMGKPVIVSRTKALEAIFRPSSVYYVDPEDPLSVAKAILNLGSLDRREEAARNALEDYSPYRWQIAKQGYLSLVCTFIRNPNEELGGRKACV